MNPERIASVCHAANKAYCECIGDLSQKPWSETPVEIRNSVISGVEKLIDDPSLTPEEMHQNWVRYKLAEGWSYGRKDIEKKQHPNLVPFSELPKDEQVKDHLFVAIVRVLANLPAGYTHV